MVYCDLHAVWEVGTSVLEEHLSSLSILMMEAVCSSRALVPTYQTTWYHHPDHSMNFPTTETSNPILVICTPSLFLFSTLYQLLFDTVVLQEPQPSLWHTSTLL